MTTVTTRVAFQISQLCVLSVAEVLFPGKTPMSFWLQNNPHCNTFPTPVFGAGWMVGEPLAKAWFLQHLNCQLPKQNLRKSTFQSLTPRLDLGGESMATLQRAQNLDFFGVGWGMREPSRWL